MPVQIELVLFTLRVTTEHSCFELDGALGLPMEETRPGDGAIHLSSFSPLLHSLLSTAVFLPLVSHCVFSVVM